MRQPRSGRFSKRGTAPGWALLLTVLVSLCTAAGAQGAGVLEVEILSGPNLVVDSNVLSPSTRAPSVATVAGRFCNTGDAPLTGVQGFIGDFGALTPGLYPVRDSSSASFISQHPLLANTGAYSLTHVGGTIGTLDATRFVGTVDPGECQVVYWHFTYPRTNPAETVPVWGASNDPNDDLWLEFDIWGTSNEAPTVDETFRVTMRNEISAMANQIFPNGGDWFNTSADVVFPGQTITSNGINYTLGVINKGFDNDGDLQYDYNAWLQPVGSLDWDPSCFRLVKVDGTLTITRSSGNPDLVINFEDQLYFTDLPKDNTGGVGEVHYTFLALSGPCSLDLSPYQEVASGADNEKFNADYGKAIPPLGSFEPAVTLDKGVDAAFADPFDTLTYTLDFDNTGAAPAGFPQFGVPLVLSDSIPAGTSYVAGSAAISLTFVPSEPVTILYSTDNRVTWTTTEPATASDVTDLRWWLNDSLAVGESGQATFRVEIDGPIPSTPFIENTGQASFGDAPPFAEDTTLTLVRGPNSIGDLVWRDDDTDGAVDVGEPGIPNVTVRLYWDRDGNGVLDSQDVLIVTDVTDTAGAYGFADLPDGDFLVAVDTADPDIPFGFSRTTVDTYAATGLGSTLPSPFDTADFGFGPSLLLDKQLTSVDPALEGDLVSFSIDLTNTRASSVQGCAVETWAEEETLFSQGQSANKRFKNPPIAAPTLPPSNALGAQGPDGVYAFADYAVGANNLIGGVFYSVPVQSGRISRVEAAFQIYLDGVLTDDFAVARLLYNGAEVGSATFTSTTLNNFVGQANAGLLTWDVSALRTWDWADFTAINPGTGRPSLALRFELAKDGGSDPRILYLDAFGFRVTSGASCAINPLPLVDTYDADLLQFVSAQPPVDGLTITGTPPSSVGTLSWTNLGPLGPGATTSVSVTFRALEPPDSDAIPDGEPDPAITTNTGTSAGATFANGDPVNTATDNASVTINPAGVISGVVWADNGSGGGGSMNGLRDGAEPGIPGVTVELFADTNGDGVADGPVLATQVTDATGAYAFTAIPDGNYVAVVDTATLPGSTFNQYGDPDEAGVCTVCDDDGSALIDYTDGDPATDDATGVDFGYTVPNTFFGSVWEDNDGDGTQEAGENGIAGVTVELWNAAGNLITSTTTDASGNYQFSDLLDGTYRVVVRNDLSPLGATFTQTSDPDATLDNQTALITVSGGDIVGPNDFGYQETGSSQIGDTLYVDWNGDGNQDAGEEGIVGVTVTLYEDANGDGIVDPTTDAVVAITTTGAGGAYSFSGLPAGTFLVVVDESALPTNYTPTDDPDETGVCAVCDGRASVTTNGTASVLTVDFGYQPTGTATIGDTVFRDDDFDGVQDALEPGISSIRVTLYEDTNGNGTIDAADAVVGAADTDASGNYLFINLPAGRFIVDVDTADADLPLDGNGDPYVLSTGNDPSLVILGVGESRLDLDFGFTAGGTIGDFLWQDDDADGDQDPAEPGVPNVTVSLYYDTNGNGVFDPGTDTLAATTTTDANGEYFFQGLPAGEYVVVVDTTDVDLPSTTVTGDPDVAGPCDAANPLCDGELGVSLLPGRTFLGADFGFQTPGVIGDAVFLDENGNGAFDPTTDVGLSGVTVQLYNDTNGNGIFDPGTDTLAATTTTDGNGAYLFTGLADGNYVVVIVAASLPPGMTQTVDPDAVINNQSGVTIAGGSSDLDVDFGYIQDASSLLLIDKVSSATGFVNPGDTITYTITVTNPSTNPARATDIAISDPLPPGTTYVAVPGTSVTAPRDYRDEFRAIAYDGSDASVDWSPTPWTEPTDDGSALTGNIRVTADQGDYSILMVGPNTRIERIVNLVSSTTRTISFYYRRVDMEGADSVVLQINDGATWRTVATFSGSGGGVTDSSYLFYSSSAVLTASDVAIRFVTNSFNPTDDSFFIDDLEIDMGTATVTSAGGAPPLLVDPVHGYFLESGESMTVTFSAVVDNPLAAGISQIRNEAAAKSAEMLEPIFDLVIDRVNPGGTIGDRVWLDSDGDGVQDVGETGLANVLVSLFEAGADGVPGGGDDVLVATTITDLDGGYAFTGLLPGTYYVDVTSGVPAGLATSPGTTDPSSTVTVTAAEVFRDVDFGYSNASSATALIGDFVWSDADGDGTQDPGEPGIGGVLVRLLDGNGVAVATTTTRADGFYLFDGVAPGDYTVEIDAGNFTTGGALEGYSATSGAQSEGANESNPITVVAGSSFLDADFGYRNSGLFSITEGVFFDNDADGLRDAGEIGIAGVTVNLLDPSGTVIATTISGPDGSFTFSGLENGSYTVQISDNRDELSGLSGTTTAAVNGSTPVVLSGADLSGFSFGYNVPGAIGDTIFSDADGDGVQDPGEPGIAGVTVELWLDDGDGVFDDAVDTLLSTTVTDATGFYRFEGLGAGTYFVSIDDGQAGLAGYAPTTSDQETGPNAAGTQIEVTLASANAGFLDADFGYQNTALANVSGNVFEDLDEDGVDDGAGEAGIAGVTVALIDGTSGLVVATATTDAFGNYSFLDVAAGDYRVAVTDEDGALTGFRLTSGFDVLDVTVAAGDVTGIDFGYVRDADTGRIGDLLWLDADRDGVLDGAENGIGGITVRLYDAGPDGQIGGGDDVLVATAATDGNGRYSFSGLEAGVYFVDPDEATLPAGLTSTTGTPDTSALIQLSQGEEFFSADFGYAGGATSALGDRVWYDADGDGFQDPGEAGIGGVDLLVRDSAGTLIATVTTAADGSWLVTGLAPGNYTVTVDTTSLPAGFNTTPTNQVASAITVVVVAGEDALSADFGFNGGTTGSIGDTVFFDDDGDGVQDAGEPGVAGVTLQLLDSSGSLVGTATTDQSGAYDFVGLLVDTYTVQITDNAGVLSGLNLSTPPVGSIVLAAGQDFDDADFGYAPAPGTGSIGNLVWHDTTPDGFRAPSESGIQGVTIALWRDTNGDGILTPGVDNFLRTTTTDINGEYEFKGLPAGNYLVDVTDTAGVLTGFTLVAAGNSRPDPYAVNLGAPPNDFTADFGYAGGGLSITGVTFDDVNANASLDVDDKPEGAIRLYLYRDLDGDGVIDPGDPIIGRTLSTPGTGTYTFTDLPPGDYIVRADAAGSVLDGYRQTTQTTTSAIQPVTLIAAASTGNDFGFNLRATLVVITSFRAFVSDGVTVVEWVTSAEVGTAGFFLYRWDDGLDDWTLVHSDLLPALHGAPQGGTYRLVDVGAATFGSHTYALVELEHNGAENDYGPFDVDVEVLAAPPQMSDNYTAEPHPVPAKMKGRLAQHRQERGRSDALRKGNGRGSGGAVKITVDEVGLHRLGAQELAGLFGWPLPRMRAAIKTGDLTLTNRGRLVAWTQEGRDDGILFFAEEVRSDFTRSNVYWLEPGRGLEMDTIPNAGARPVAMDHGFEETLHFEEDVFPVTVVAIDPDEGFWFWDRAIAGHRVFGRRALAFSAPSPVAGGTARVDVTLQGVYDSPGRDFYRARLYVNGNWIGDTVGRGLERHRAALAFDVSLLLDGSNVLEIEALREPGMVSAGFFIDSFDLSYERRFEARDEAVIVAASGESVITVSGFVDGAIRVLDLSSPSEPVRLEGNTVTRSGAGYSVSFVPPLGSSRFLAASAAAVTTVEDAVVRRPAGLETQAAEYLVITARELVEAAQELADYRQSQGLQTLVVDLEDIIDEFNDGIAEPQAVRNFLGHAYRSWALSPRFVVLAGAGNFDYLDAMGLGGNIIPALMVRTPFGLFSSDNLYGDVIGGDGVPEVAIGRLPVLTAGELRGYLTKLAAYEVDSGNGWKDHVLMVADNADTGGTFEEASDALLDLIPASTEVTRLYVGELGGQQTRQLLLQELGAGTGWMNYLGHGAINILAGESILRDVDVSGLGNGSRLPVVSALTCNVARFEIPGFVPLAQSLILEPTGGAIAVWAPSGQSIHGDARLLNQSLFQEAFGGRHATVGEITTEALRAYSRQARYPFMPFVYNLQGDPATVWK